MKEPKRRRSIDGVVLIMVLTVMAVLIVILMTTLTVVTTANQRIYTKFEENQAYYTARSALDIFTAQMLEDREYYIMDASGSGPRQYKYSDSASATGTSSANMKQGLALQGELYKIKSKGETTKKIASQMASSHGWSFTNANPASDALGFVENITTADNVFGTLPDSSPAPENNFFSISNTATNAAGTKDYIEYKVTLPAMGNGTNLYGRLVDENSSGEQVATIKVEVLDRVFNTSPPFTVEDMIVTIQDGTAAEKQALKDAIKNGDRTKDKLRVKVTATVEFMGTQGTASIIFDSYEAKMISSSRAVTSLSDMSQGSGMFPIGGASALHDGTITFADDSKSTGSIYITEGSLYLGASDSVYLGGGDMLFVKKNFSAQNSLPIIKKHGATIFIGGDFSTGSLNGDIGSSGAKANLIVGGTFTIGGANFGQYYGKLFCDTLDLSSATGDEFNNADGVYTNHLSASMGIPDLDSNWNIDYNDAIASLDYTTGTVTLDSLTWPTVPAKVYYSSTDLFATKTFEKIISYYPVKKDVLTITVKYDPVSNTGTATTVKTHIDEGAGTETSTEETWSNVVLTNGILGTPLGAPTCSAFNLDLNNYTANPVNGEYLREIGLPSPIIESNGGTGDPKVSIPTIQYLYSEFFDPSAFNANGNFDFTPSSPTLTQAQIDAEYSAFLDSKVVTSEQKLGGVATLDKFSDYVTVESRDPALEATYPSNEQIPASFTKVINASGKLKTVDSNGNATGGPDSYRYDLCAIDARSGPIEIQLGNDAATNESYYSGQFVVFGDNEVTFYFAGNQKINIGGPTGSCTFEVYTKEIYDSAISTPTLNLGDCANPTSAPKINLYASKDVPTVGFGHSSFVCGYFYTPKSIFDLAGGMNGKSFNTNYDNYNIGNTAYGVVGSVLCKGYTSSQKVGVAYISTDASSHNYGDPYLTWRAYRYTRG